MNTFNRHIFDNAPLCFGWATLDVCGNVKLHKDEPVLSNCGKYYIASACDIKVGEVGERGFVRILERKL
jgi:hypothetical protein